MPQSHTTRTQQPGEVRIPFKFTVDAGNAPALVASPLNVGIQSVSRVSQGLYRLTLKDTYRYHVDTDAKLNVNGAAVALWAQGGPVANFGTASQPTVDILITDNAGAVQNPPAANSNNFVSGEIICCDVNAV